MTAHLDDRTLLDVLGGEGSPPERVHPGACAVCARRSARLARDLDLVGNVLRDGPLPRPVARPAALRRWVPLAAAAVTTAALLAWGLSGHTPPPAQVTGTRTLSLSDVSAAMFATDDVEQLAKPVRGAELTALEAALRGEWPGARHDPWLGQGTD
jgi:hypothetical protein